MSCSNVAPTSGQRYFLTYPEKNAAWWSRYPDKCTQQRQDECKQRMLYTPTPANSCQSTFVPSNRPSPQQALELCKGIQIKKISGCVAEQLKYPKRINNNGCLMEPSVMTYENVPLSKGGSCNNRSTSILTDPKRFAPNVPQYAYKDSDAYDPIQYVFGNPYTY
jgi:hypothetical protein